MVVIDALEEGWRNFGLPRTIRVDRGCQFTWKELDLPKFTDAQKAFILKQAADGVTVEDICRKAGISRATDFYWKRKYDGLLPTEMRRLKQLEDENSKLLLTIWRRISCRTFCAENFEACPEAKAG